MIDINKPLYLAYEWDLTEVEIKKLEAAKCGDSVKLDTSPFPAIFSNDVEQNWFLFAFDTQEKAGDDFLFEYSITEHSLDFILVIMRAFHNLGKKNIVLAVNVFDKNPKYITMEDLEELLKIPK